MARTLVRSPAPARVVFDGQSLARFPDFPISGEPAPRIAMRSFAGVPSTTVAISNTSYDDLLPTFATRVAPQVRPTGGDIIVLLGGQSNVFAGQSGATCYASMTAYVNACNAAGFATVIACTLPDMGPNVLVPEPYRANLADFNARIRANAAGADAVCELHVPPLDDATDTAVFFGDRVHVNAAGAYELSRQLVTSLAPFLT